MSYHHLSARVSRRVLVATAAAGAVAMAVGVTAAWATTRPNAHEQSFSFSLKRSAAVVSCLPHASGRVTITTGSLNDTMTVSLRGMPRNSGFDLFVIQQPNKPFGISWYQSDLTVGRNGAGSATVRGIFSSQTFSVSPGGAATFGPTHQYHLGLWFNNPRIPFNLGCEPGAKTPVVTPFNGEQRAGIQALNTANFPVSKGPLSHVHG
jgi:hypothetical protein